MLSGWKPPRKNHGKPITVVYAVTCDAPDQCSAQNSTGTNGTSIASSMQNSAVSTFLTTAMRELLGDYLHAHHYHEDFIACVQQVVRAAILWKLNTSAWRIAATPILQQYFYQFLEDNWDDEATTESIASWLATGTMLTIDLAAIPLGLSDASALGTLASYASSVMTRTVMSNSYHWIRSNLFAPGITQKTESVAANSFSLKKD